MNAKELKLALDNHRLWLNDDAKGVRADLRGAKTDKRYIQVSCIGSRKDMTTYCFENNEILCGCYKGTLEDFEAKVKEVHKDNKQYLAEYLGFIEYVKKLKGVV